MSTRRERAAKVVLAELADDLRARGLPMEHPRLLDSVLATQAVQVDIVEAALKAEVARDRAALVEQVKKMPCRPVEILGQAHAYVQRSAVLAMITAASGDGDD